MIEGLVSGKLHGKAERRTGKSGKPFVVAKVRAAAGEGETLFVNVVAFSEEASAALLALRDGDAVSLAGSLTPKAWTDREGKVRPALDMIANQVMTAYHAKRKREVVTGDQRQPRPLQREEFGDGQDDWLQRGHS